MTIDYRVVPANHQHIEELARNMRPADIDEVWASSHARPFEALFCSRLGSRDTRSGLADGRVVCMFGVCEARTLLGGVTAAPWLLGAVELPDHARRFLRLNKSYIAAARKQYPLLRNYVDARNVQAIRWLCWLGFAIKDPIPYGPEFLPFHPFEMWGVENAGNQEGGTE